MTLPPAYDPYQTPISAGPYPAYQMSDKSKVVAGLLQLLLGMIFALGGVGRLYAGHTGLGVVQLLATMVGWVSFWCAVITMGLSWFVFAAIWLWFVIDGIVLLAGRPTDGQGRPLRS